MIESQAPARSPKLALALVSSVEQPDGYESDDSSSPVIRRSLAKETGRFAFFAHSNIARFLSRTIRPMIMGIENQWQFEVDDAANPFSF